MACNRNLGYTFFPRLFRHLALRKSHSVASVKNVYQTKEKLEKNPFMKNVFLGLVDKDILSFPEVEIRDNESGIFFENTASQPEGKCVANGGKSFISVLKSGLCRFGFPEFYGGLPCNSTHLIKQVEKLDISPATSFLLETQYTFIINNILNHGSDLQKNLYLKGLITGEIIGAYSLYEENAGSDPASLHSNATLNESDGSFTLNGEKSSISNGRSANIFVVFAQVKEANNLTSPNLLSAFLIDRETPGLVIMNEQSFDGYDMCRLKLDNVHLTPENVIGEVGDGYKIAVNSFESSKFILVVTVINIIRKLISDVTHHISKTKRFPISFKEYELLQYKLGKLMTTMYAIESSVYFLAGLQDNYVVDTTLESVIMQNIAFSYGLSIAKECVSIFGTRAFDSTRYTYKSLLDELILLSRSFTSPEMFMFYVSLKGLEHTGRTMKDKIARDRNPLNNVMFFFKRMLESRRHMLDSPKLNKHLYMQLHPSLKVDADQLEYCVSRLQYTVETLLGKHGSELVNRQLDLVRLASVVTDIFSMFAVLSRASRAYCTGIRYSDQEMLAAHIWCQETTKKIKINISDILGRDLIFQDVLYLKLAPDILQNRGYFFRNPMEKNIY